MVPRVAMREEALPRDIAMDVGGPGLVELRGALLELLSAETVRSVSHATVRGPCFANVASEEADELDASRRFEAVPIRGTDQVAVSVGEWRLQEVQITLYADDGWDDDDDRSEIATVEVLAGGTTARITTIDGECVDKDVDPACVGATLQRVVRGAQPTLAKCMQRVEDHCTDVRSFGDGDKRMFELPAWCGEVFARYASVRMRLHVLLSAPHHPLGSTRPLCLDHGGVLSRGRRGDVPITRLTFPLHQSCAACTCSVHGDAPCTELPHRAVKVCFEFCGACVASNGARGCRLHGDTAPSSTNSLNARICSAARRVVLLCTHGDGTAFKNKVCADLPHDDPFLATFAAAAVELVDPNSSIPAHKLRAAVCQQFQAHVSGAVDRESDDTMLVRDQLALNLIATGNHYFGYSQRQKRSRMLRTCDGALVADKVLKRAMLTHSHLLPSAAPHA